MVITEKKELIIKIVCLVIIIALCIAIYINNKNLDCDKCIVKFKNMEISGYKLPEPIIIEQNLTELYELFIQDKCKITWDRVYGYQQN